MSHQPCYCRYFNEFARLSCQTSKFHLHPPSLLVRPMDIISKLWLGKLLMTIQIADYFLVNFQKLALKCQVFRPTNSIFLTFFQLRLRYSTVIIQYFFNCDYARISPNLFYFRKRIVGPSLESTKRIVSLKFPMGVFDTWFYRKNGRWTKTNLFICSIFDIHQTKSVCLDLQSLYCSVLMILFTTR